LQFVTAQVVNIWALKESYLKMTGSPSCLPGSLAHTKRQTIVLKHKKSSDDFVQPPKTSDEFTQTHKNVRRLYFARTFFLASTNFPLRF
jgi:phosphopantetheinyl transferase